MLTAIADLLVIFVKKVIFTSFNLGVLVGLVLLWSRLRRGAHHPRRALLVWGFLAARFLYDMAFYHPSARLDLVKPAHGMLTIGLGCHLHPLHVRVLTAVLELQQAVWSVGDLACWWMGPSLSLALGFALLTLSLHAFVRTLLLLAGSERVAGCSTQARLLPGHPEPVHLCDGAPSPFVFGFLRPRIAFPRALLSLFSVEELRVVLAHEAAHARRRDSVLFPVLALLEATFFYVLPLRLVCSRIAEYVEQVCDQEAARDRDQRHHLGHALLKLAEFQQRGRRPAAPVLPPHVLPCPARRVFPRGGPRWAGGWLLSRGRPRGGAGRFLSPGRPRWAGGWFLSRGRPQWAGGWLLSRGRPRRRPRGFAPGGLGHPVARMLPLWCRRAASPPGHPPLGK